MSKSRFFSFRLLSAIAVALLVATVAWAKPNIEIAAQTICISPLGYPCPSDGENG